MKYQHHVVVEAPVDRVFDYMDDVTREKEWQPGTSAHTATAMAMQPSRVTFTPLTALHTTACFPCQASKPA